MLTLETPAKIYIGRGVGRIVMDRISRAKYRVYILSPFISKNLRARLGGLWLGNRNVDIKVFQRPKEIHINIARAAIFLLALAFLPFFPPASLFLIALFFIIKPSYYSHAKIFVIDDTAFLASANFTYSGLLLNYEFLVEIKGKEVDRIVAEVFR